MIRWNRATLTRVFVGGCGARGAFLSPDLVLGTLPNQSYNAPEGLVYVDAENNHVWRSARIGKIDTDGSFDLVWESGRALRPVPLSNLPNES